MGGHTGPRSVRSSLRSPMGIFLRVTALIRMAFPHLSHSSPCSSLLCRCMLASSQPSARGEAVGQRRWLGYITLGKERGEEGPMTLARSRTRGRGIKFIGHVVWCKNHAHSWCQGRGLSMLSANNH